ncbi:MAG TPA: hypothetical protein VGD56_05070 [Gemmatirosa sp.]
MNGGPPDNAAYFHAAYVLIAFVYGGYAAVLLRRRARVRQVLDRLGAPDLGAPSR